MLRIALRISLCVALRIALHLRLRLFPEDVIRHMLRSDVAFVSEVDGTLHDVFELSDIARPAIALQIRIDIRQDFKIRSLVSVITVHEEVSQPFDILRTAVAQSRRLDGKDVQSVV